MLLPIQKVVIISVVSFISYSGLGWMGGGIPTRRRWSNPTANVEPHSEVVTALILSMTDSATWPVLFYRVSYSRLLLWVTLDCQHGEALAHHPDSSPCPTRHLRYL